ncbi:uncharacterized protein LTR77_011073 [Saxophila tyrrhenica]|uniref:Uncharacterized protein n=1 Tax=Saxophila tyrrhenica TaxID=1690608 RepID=A0AAV9NXI1_9PEZI|nr:hypothetical protein LTR77_011073 [Saxophila tyrrhenica]
MLRKVDLRVLPVLIVIYLLQYLDKNGINYFYAPDTVLATSEAPYYHSAYIAMLVGYSVKLLMAAVLYVYMFTASNKRDGEAAAAGVVDDEEEKAAIEMERRDSTEMENEGLRYSL